MAIKTIPIQDFEKRAEGNIYRGILLVAKRARQINERIAMEEKQYEVEYDEENEEEIEEIDTDEKPKPVVTAMDEYFENKIKEKPGK
jgi:DNA-directed RNA polymerase subunit K/omega